MAAAAQIEITEPRKLNPAVDPEFILLCACCRGSLDETAIRGTLPPGLDWERLLKLASHHRILPALWTSLGNHSEVGARIRSSLRARFTVHVQRALRFSALLMEILEHFAKSGIEVLAHKGPVLSQKLYGDPAMREFGDLDFLVCAKDMARARQALGQLGYESHLQLSPRQEREYLRSGYEYVFGTGRERSLIELQWHILPRFYAIDFDFDALFARAKTCTLSGRSVPILGDEDLLLVLCAHAAKHEWVHWGMIRDIAALSRCDLNWPWVRAEAERLGIVRIVAVSLLLARNLLDRNLPECFLRHTEIAIAQKFASAAAACLARGQEPEPETLDYFRRMLRLRERRRDRARCLWRLASTPSVGEWEAVRIPDILFPLYRGVRGVRLAKRAFSKLI